MTQQHADYESDFTNAENTIPSSCERPSIGCDCKALTGENPSPPGKLCPWQVRHLQRTIWICEPCASYMAQKKTTTMTQAGSNTTALFTRTQAYPVPGRFTINHAAIQAGTNAGQRGDIIRPPVVALPTGTHSSAVPSSLNTFPNYHRPSSTVPPPQTGPHLNVPGISSPLFASPGYSGAHRTYPMKQSAQARRASAPGPPVLAASPRESYTLRYSVKCQYGGRASAKVIFNIQSNGIRDVDAYSTGPQLRDIISKALTAPWRMATHDYPLTPDMWTLRNKSDVDIVAAFPTSPAFYSNCVSALASGKGRFIGGKTMDAVVMLTAAAYSEVESHIEEMSTCDESNPVAKMQTPSKSSASYSSAVPAPNTASEKASSSATLSRRVISTPNKSTKALFKTDTTGLTTPTSYALAKTQTPSTSVALYSSIIPATSVSPGTAPFLSTLSGPVISTPSKPAKLSCKTDTTGLTTPTNPSKKRALALSPTSLVRSPPAKRVSSAPIPTPVPWNQLLQAVNPTKLGDALRKHGADVKPKGFDRSRLYTTEFFPLVNLPISELSERNLSDELSNSRLALAGVITLNISLENELGTGSFKKCILGSLVLHTAPPTGLGSSGSQPVALKRPYYQDSSTTHQRAKRLPPSEELCFVTKEAVLWLWGTSLYALVLEYMKNHAYAEKEGAPTIPLVRFVQAGVAKLLSADAGEAALAGAMLVEERIPSNYTFLRFVGNGSAVPYPFPTNTYEHTLAQFCSFCQHVQWVMTGGQVYCADWQGGSSGSLDVESLLTDPQIMTNPLLGDKLFAGGNIPEAFDKFLSEHQCAGNIFCEFYEPVAYRSSEE
ncbi:hypothetical protein FRC12_008543 [Ceratobasidium sp. 428]|nr:hypothetical protein FRC12_008543 [Ceratobasidium sp. 428]